MSQVLFGEEDKPEVVRSYDSDTGEELANSIDSVVRNEEQRTLLEMQLLEALTRTPGWKLVDEFLSAQKEKLSEELLTQTNYDEIRRIQEFLKAYLKLEAFIIGKINEGRRFVEETQKQPTDPTILVG